MPEVPRRDYYGALKLPPLSSIAVVRQRYRRLAKKLHPDVNHAPDAAERFREIEEAYRTLSDPVTREAVDSWYLSGSDRRLAQRGRAERRPFTSPRRGVGVDRASDLLLGFGCFGVPTFFLGMLGVFATGSTLGSQFAIAVTAAVFVGTIAAYGGDRAREALLWWLRWL